MPRRIAFINEKGGSGKTTLVANTACYLALKRGRRTLAIDMDPQGQLGKVLGLEVRRPARSAIELLVSSVLGDDDDASRSEALDHPSVTRGLPITKTRIPNLDVVVSNRSIGLVQGGPEDLKRGAELRLAENLAQSPEIDKYDYVFFDAPPSFGPLTLSVLLACDEVAVPVPLTYLALDGFAELNRTIAMVRRRYDHRELAITMVIPTFYRRTRLAHEILEKLRTRFPKEISQTVLGLYVKVDEAQSHGLSIFEYAPSDRSARAMAAIAEELEARGKHTPRSRPAAASPAQVPVPTGGGVVG